MSRLQLRRISEEVSRLSLSTYLFIHSLFCWMDSCPLLFFPLHRKNFFTEAAQVQQLQPWAESSMCLTNNNVYFMKHNLHMALKHHWSNPVLVPHWQLELASCVRIWLENCFLFCYDWSSSGLEGCSPLICQKKPWRVSENNHLAKDVRMYFTSCTNSVKEPRHVNTKSGTSESIRFWSLLDLSRQNLWFLFLPSSFLPAAGSQQIRSLREAAQKTHTNEISAPIIHQVS